MSARALRVALLHHSYGTPYGGEAEPVVRALARALRDAGHEVHVLTSGPGPTRRRHDDGVEVVRLARLPEAPLRFRGFEDPITHIPSALRELARGAFDVAHAFSAQDAWAAIRSSAPAVFTCASVLDRDELASRRLRASLLATAVERSGAVLVPGEAQRAALWRWMAVEASVVDPADAPAHERVYRELR